MRVATRLILAAVVATLSMLAIAGLASARTRIEVSTTAILKSGRVTFEGGIGNVICDVTYHATLLRLINKVRLEHFGDITSILTANARANTGLAAGCNFLAPMRMAYGSIRGTLPTITGAEIQVLLRFLIRLGSTECLYQLLIRLDTSENPVRLDRGQGGVLELRLLRDEFFRRCPEEVLYFDSMTWTPAITIILLER